MPSHFVSKPRRVSAETLAGAKGAECKGDALVLERGGENVRKLEKPVSQGAECPAAGLPAGQCPWVREDGSCLLQKGTG